jgi:methyltransferase-like protein
MSIEQKIAQLVAEGKQLQEDQATEDVVVEETEVIADEAITEETVEELTVDVSEDVAALVDGEELSEEFKTKAATIFEAAVVTRVKSEMTKLEEQFEVQLAEQVETIKEGLVEKVDGYLNYVVEQWMTDNEIALENGMKNEILESFVSGMKGLFEQHYIEVPEEKFDILGQMQEEVETLKSKLDEQLAISVELSGKVNAMTRESSIAESAKSLSDLDAEKFRGLAEELAFDDAESFAAKLQTIKESYFGAKRTSTSVQSVVSDQLVEELTEEKKIDPIMAGYLRAFKS